VPSAFAACNNPKFCLSGLRRLRLARSPAPGQICNHSGASMNVKSHSLSSFVSPELILLPRQTIGAVGRRSGASFFARHLDYFAVTQNSQPLPGLVTFTQLHRDPWLLVRLPGLAKNVAPRRRRHLIKPPGR
jgi:hypothetical protein